MFDTGEKPVDVAIDTAIVESAKSLQTDTATTAVVAGRAAPLR
jgi:hypothetical protein